MDLAPALDPASDTHPVGLTVWIDLRTQVPEAAELTLGPEADLVEAVRAAQSLALGPAGPLPLIWPVPDALHHAPRTLISALDAVAPVLALPEAFSLLVRETLVSAAPPELVDTLGRARARGFGVALEGDPAMPLPFGRGARGLYTQLVVDARAAQGSQVQPFTALGERLLAARGAGLTLAARGISLGAGARTLAVAGFDRGIPAVPRRVHIATASTRVSSMASSFSSR
jgi:hypothetical protein